MQKSCLALIALRVTAVAVLGLIFSNHGHCMMGADDPAYLEKCRIAVAKCTDYEWDRRLSTEERCQKALRLHTIAALNALGPNNPAWQIAMQQEATYRILSLDKALGSGEFMGPAAVASDRAQQNAWGNILRDLNGWAPSEGRENANWKNFWRFAKNIPTFVRMAAEVTAVGTACATLSVGAGPGAFIIWFQGFHEMAKIAEAGGKEMANRDD